MSDERIVEEFYQWLIRIPVDHQPAKLVNDALTHLVKLSGCELIYVELRSTKTKSVKSMGSGAGMSLAAIQASLSHGIVDMVFETQETVQTVANSDARFADNASVKQNEIEHVLAFPVSSDADRVVVYLQRRGPFDTTDRARAEFLGMQLGLVISKLVNEQIDSSADERATRRRNVLAALDHRSWNVTEAAQSGWMFRSHRWPTGK